MQNSIAKYQTIIYNKPQQFRFSVEITYFRLMYSSNMVVKPANIDVSSQLYTYHYFHVHLQASVYDDSIFVAM